MKQSENELRRTAQKYGYRIQKAQGGYTLVDQSRNAVLFNYDRVPLADIAKFFEVETRAI